MSPKFIFNVRYNYYRTINQAKTYFYSGQNVVSIIDTMLYQYIQYKRAGKNPYPPHGAMQDVPQIIDEFKTKYKINPSNSIMMTIAYSQYHRQDDEIVFFFNHESIMSILFVVLTQYLRDKYTTRLTNQQILDAEHEANRFLFNVTPY